MSNFLDVNNVRGSMYIGGYGLDVDGDGRAGRRKGHAAFTIPFRTRDNNHHD